MAQAHEIQVDGDPFANFAYNPPRPSGRFRYYQRRHKYAQMAQAGFSSLASSREKLAGSSSNLSNFGSQTDLTLDPVRRMSMQEDAKSRKISSEIMKYRLYESVITSPRRRRMSMRMDYHNEDSEIRTFARAARMAQSLPVTPAITPGNSQSTSPVGSPTQSRKFFYGYYSRGTTPDEERKFALGDSLQPPGPVPQPAPPPDEYQGIASIFRPRPRCFTIHRVPQTLSPSPAPPPEENDQPMEDVESRLGPADTMSLPGHSGFWQDGRGDGVFRTPTGKPPRSKSRSPKPESGPGPGSGLHSFHNHLHPSNPQTDVDMETDEPPGCN